LREVHDASGRSWLWAATNQGLSRFDGARWQTYARDIGLPEPNLIGLNLIPDAAGHQILWLGTTSAGVTRVDITNPLAPRVLPNDLPPPPDPATYSPQVDSKGRIYICTNNGVQQLTPSANGYVSHNFNRRDGMVHQECNHIQMVDAHDRFWTGTMGGLAVYDPQRELHDNQPKPLKIIDMQIDGRLVQGTDLDVPAGAKDIRVDYALLSWYREADSRFRTQLVGYDPAPSDWTDQNFRSFNSLPPGHYTLRIEARDHAGNASTPIEIAMVLHPQWWQQLWVRLAGALVLLLLGYTVVLLRTRQLRAQRHALEQHIAMRTAELNVANARLVDLSYQDALTGLANRRRLLEALEQPAGATTLILLDVDHFKQYNDRFGHMAGDEALRCVGAALSACAGPQVLVARYGGEEFACLLTDTDPALALALAESIRLAVESCEIPVPGGTQSMRITISAGVASAMLASSEDALRLLRQADLALYQAKHDGRNRVRRYSVDAASANNATA
jgi:diguanylate cyclase (GGDEF)-like protein